MSDSGLHVAGGGVDSGIIGEWSGTIANIPAGWVICDGNAGTQNLLNKFIKSVVDAVTNPGATGGAATHALTTAQLASHSHGGVGHPTNPYKSTGGDASDHNSQGGCNNINTTTAAAGSGSAHPNEPAYYALAYVMKT